MKGYINRRFTVLALFFLIAAAVSAQTFDKTSVIGKWEFTSYTQLQHGKPSGSVNFAPGTMLFTYHEDGSWEMEAADATHTKLKGSYEIRGSELTMKKADGSPYQDWEVEMKNNGQEMVLQDKRSISTARKVQTTP